ncbi:MAG: hypothetical protein L0Z50_19450 [Verrucomicrobiales bacterium]|nr:hypothetical protein [Verrucomicrobiales bacterium]
MKLLSSAAVGYSITSFGALPRPGSLDTSFDPGFGPDGRVTALALQSDGKIVIVGEFSRVDGMVRRNFARLNADGSVDPSFDPGPGIIGSKSIYALAIQRDDRILLGGWFTNYNGRAVTNLVQVNHDGSLDESFGPDFPIGIVQAITVLDDDSLLIGQQRRTSLPSESGLMHLDRNGHLLGPLNPALFQAITAALPIAPGKLLVRGYIQEKPNSYSIEKLARIDLSGEIDPRFSADLPFTFGPFDIEASGQILVCGVDSGPFTVPAFQPIYRLWQDGRRETNFVVHLPARNPWEQTVATIHVTDGNRILIGGTFVKVDDQARSGIAWLLADGRLDPGFHPGTGCRGPNNSGPSVQLSLVQPDGKILISGDFTEVDGQPRARLARLHGGILPDGPPTVFDQPSNLAVVQGQTAWIAARIISAEALSLQWRRNGLDLLGATNETLVISRAELSDVGEYTLVASNVFGLSTSAPARLDVLPSAPRPGSVDVTFHCEPVSSVSRPNFVSAVLELPDGKLVIAGPEDPVVSSDPVPSVILRLNTDGTPDPAFPRVSVTGTIRELVRQDDGKILVGGNFLLPTQTVSSALARLNEDGTWDPGFAFVPFVWSSWLPSTFVRQRDGKILVGAQGSHWNPVGVFGTPSAPPLPIGRGIFRLLPDGEIDGQFSGAIRR